MTGAPRMHENHRNLYHNRRNPRRAHHRVVLQFAQSNPPLVIPKPGLSVRNLLPAGSKAADCSRDNPRFGITILWGIQLAHHAPEL